MPSGIINLNGHDAAAQENMNNARSNVVNNRDGQNQPLEPLKPPSPAICKIANSGININEEQNTNRGQKRGRNYYQELWSDAGNSRMRKRMKLRAEMNDQDIQQKSPPEQKPCKPSPKSPKQTPYIVKSCRKPQSCRKAQSCQKPPVCRKPYYRKRRYCCPGKRRYKASKRCCPKKFNRNKINICNRNWARISINPFINFLRIFRRKFCKGTSPTEIARKGKCEWKKMSCNSKKKYYEQAKRARIRGYRT